MRKNIFRGLIAATLGLAMAVGVGAGIGLNNKKVNPVFAVSDLTQYSLINDVEDLEAGKSYLIASGTSGTVKTMAVTSNENNRPTTELTVSDNKLTRGSSAMSVTLGGSTDEWTFHTDNYGGTNGYLGQGNQTNKNYLKIYDSLGTGAAGDTWTISFSGDAAVITSTKKSSRNIIRCNTDGTPISCYSSGQNPVYLWKEISGGSTRTATGVTLSGDMTNKSYYQGDNWDFSGLYLRISYDDSTHQDVQLTTLTKGEDFELDEDNPTVGLTSLYIYGSFLTFDFEKTITGINVSAAPSSATFIAGTDVGSTSANATPDSITKYGFTVAGTDAAFATAEYRIYSGSDITFSVSSGYISQITIVENTTYALNLLSLKAGQAGTWNSTTGIWTGFSVSVTLTASAQFRADSISIEKVDSIPAKAVSSIALSGTYPTSFSVGDAFSHEGMVVTATYNDGTTADVTTSAVFSGYNMSNSGNQTVTVSYTEDDVTKTATYSISVIVVVPEPAVTERTLSAFIGGVDTKTVAYLVTAEIKAFKTGDTKDKYGNMTITDGENDLIIYGSTMSSGALAWNNTDTYVFTNPQNFMTNETSNALSVGMVITMKLIRCDHNEIIEGQGVITKIHASSITLSNNAVDILVGGTANLTATISPSISNSTYTWESSDESVATVVNGVVTGIGAGSATITAKVTEEVKAVCTVTVSTSVTPRTYLSSANSVATLHGKENKIVFGNLGLSNDTQYSDPFVCGDFSVTFAGGGNDGKYYTTGSGIRTYGGGTITITSSYSISAITFVWSGDSYKPSASTVASEGTYNTSTGVWTGNTTSVVFTRPSGSGHWRLQSIEVKLESSSTYVSSIAVRFGASIPKSDWDEINDHDGWTITDYGVMLMKASDKTAGSYTSVEDAFDKHASSSVLKDIHKCQNETPYADPYLDRDNYLFTVKVSFPNDSQYMNHVIYAAPYIVVNEVDYYFITEMSESIQSLAGKSVSGVDTTLSTAALTLLGGN